MLSTFERELVAMYIAIKHFLRLIEENNILIMFNNHKPLIFTFTKPPNKNNTLRRERQLHFSQFCSEIQYIKDNENEL